MRTILAVAFGCLLVVGVLGCETGGGGAAPAGTGAPASGAKKASITQDQLDDVYKLTDLDDYDKSVAAATGKLGAPQKTETDTSIWYGVSKDGSRCYQLKITKTKGHEVGTTDKSNCGL